MIKVRREKDREKQQPSRVLGASHRCEVVNQVPVDTFRYYSSVFLVPVVTHAAEYQCTSRVVHHVFAAAGSRLVGSRRGCVTPRENPEGVHTHIYIVVPHRRSPRTALEKAQGERNARALMRAQQIRLCNARASCSILTKMRFFLAPLDFDRSSSVKSSACVQSGA